jgi:cell division protein FtsW
MRRKSAYILFLAVLGLLVIGIVMLFSTSAYARDSHGDVYFFIKRQAIWIGIGLVGCIFAALVNYQFWQKTWWLWFAVALAALALCYIPHIGMRINGRAVGRLLARLRFSHRSFAKIATIFFLAAWFARREKPDGNVLSGFIIPLAIISVPAALSARVKSILEPRH